MTMETARSCSVAAAVLEPRRNMVDETIASLRSTTAMSHQANPGL